MKTKNYRQAAKNAKGRPKNWQERFLLVLSPFSRLFLLSSLGVLGALAVKMVGSSPAWEPFLQAPK